MKIYVDKIPEGGLELEEKIQPEALLIDGEGISFIKPIDVKANVLKSGSEIFVDVSVEAPVEYTCSKCLARFEDVFRKKFNVKISSLQIHAVTASFKTRNQVVIAVVYFGKVVLVKLLKRIKNS